MALTKAILDNALKAQYLDVVADMWPRKYFFWSKYVTKDRKNISGQKIHKTLSSGGNVSATAMAATGALPTGGNQTYDRTDFWMKTQAFAIKVWGEAIRASQGNKASLVDAVNSEMEGGTKDFFRYMNVLAWGDGTGELAVCGTTTASTTVTVVTTRHLRVGDNVEILVKSSGATGTGTTDATIATIPNATTFTIEDTVTTDSTYSVFKKGSRAKAVNGMRSIISTTNPISGNFLGVTRTANPWWQGNVIGSVGALTLPKIEQAFAKCRVWEFEPSVMISNNKPQAKYLDLLQGMRRSSNTLTLDGGWKGLEYTSGGRTSGWLVDQQAPYDSPTSGHIYILSPAELVHFTSSHGLFWRDYEGHVLKDNPDGTDSVIAQAIYEAEIGTFHPRAHCQMTGVTTDAEEELYG